VDAIHRIRTRHESHRIAINRFSGDGDASIRIVPSSILSMQDPRRFIHGIHPIDRMNGSTISAHVQ
jgi:hypothetical protein